MNPEAVISETKAKLTGVTDHFKQELSRLRTGRAHPSMLDGVVVEAYGQKMPLKAVAGIVAPEPQLLQITPFDPNNLKAISEAIRNQPELGLSPSDDGRVVRINFPPPTAEARQTMVKALGQKLEECLIAARQIRHEAFRRGEQAEKDKQISKDERFHFEKQVDELLGIQKTEAESLAKTKEQEILII